MKGKSVKEASLKEILDKAEKTGADKAKIALVELLQGVLELVFPKGKFSVTSTGLLKIHVDELDTEDVILLAGLVKDADKSVTLKRSGTGITIIISEKEVGEISKSE